jgi:hypothetical protein
MGILRRHCVKVLTKEGVILVEGKYVVDRWRKDFKRAVNDYEFEASAEEETRFSLNFS